ncbi:DgyrCDS13321 [Dimorphilus gyrociliatus]|uniref:DgyrCDS13321 n=1 Tax=Dimorphilus gyrociliatus TaxID=2664684 RepID=A0A7I8WAC7_9ANNE|nr:DgyrCDS13321 [Dimorphilus gyrociliatus]
MEIVKSLFLLCVIFQTTTSFSSKYRKCERITINDCKNVGYNYTLMPNVFGHTAQSETENAFVMHLVRMTKQSTSLCHDHAKFFLCAVVVPMCSDAYPPKPMVVRPCRELCEEVKKDCETTLKVFGVIWPAAIRCEDLISEENQDGEVCMQPPSKDMRKNDHRRKDSRNRDDYYTFGNSDSARNQINRCPDRFVYVPTMSNKTKKCAMACDRDVLFRETDRQFAKSWMTAWATVCFITSFLTVLTFALDASRFPFPERPVVMLAFCYAAYAIPYIIRAIVKTTACGKENNRLYTLQDGFDKPVCLVIFIFLYYFGMAGAIWWTILTFTWFLAARKGWGKESIAKLSNYFHIVAWVLPAVPTVVAIVARKVDGEQLTNLCYVGGHDRTALLGFVIVPLSALLVIGTLFILSGFCGLFNLRRHPPPDPSYPNELNIKRLERLMVRLGLFAVFYTVPTIVVLACYIYQYTYMEEWRTKAMMLRPCPHQSHCALQASIPEVIVFVIRILMQLIVGVTTGMWIWSFKTLYTWRRVLCCKSAPNKPNSQTLQPLRQPASSSSGRTGFTGHTYQLPPTSTHFRPMTNSYIRTPVNL